VSEQHYNFPGEVSDVFVRRHNETRREYVQNDFPDFLMLNEQNVKECDATGML